MFVRFITSKRCPNLRVEEGVFGLAYALRDGNDLFDYEREVLAEHLRWFDSYLSAPTRFSRSTNGPARAICWFRSSATEHIAVMFEMIAIVENHLFDVKMIKTRRPGYVVYEDTYQVAAEPFSDIVCIR
jgi:hypothetical protein